MSAAQQRAPFRVGLIGLGTVGQGVVRVLQRNAAEIAGRAGRSITVTHASVRNPTRPRDCDLSGIELHADAAEIVAADVDVVVELIGGISPARELVLAALERGKPVVTANKALLAEKGKALKPRGAAGRKGKASAKTAAAAEKAPRKAPSAKAPAKTAAAKPATAKKAARKKKAAAKAQPKVPRRAAE